MEGFKGSNIGTVIFGIPDMALASKISGGGGERRVEMTYGARRASVDKGVKGP